MVGLMAYRFKEGDTIDIRFNEHNPKESVFGFEIFKPVETLGGTGLVFLAIGFLLNHANRAIYGLEQDTKETEALPY